MTVKKNSNTARCDQLNTIIFHHSHNTTILFFGYLFKCDVSNNNNHEICFSYKEVFQPFKKFLAKHTILKITLWKFREETGIKIKKVAWENPQYLPWQSDATSCNQVTCKIIDSNPLLGTAS